MNKIVKKVEKIRKALVASAFDMAVISRRDNFFWLTGSESGVCLNGDYIPAFFIVTQSQTYIVGNNMDVYRIREEALDGLEAVEIISVKWYESIPEKIRGILEAKKVVSDSHVPNTVENRKFFTALQYPFSDEEIEDYREASREAEAALCKVTKEIRPGMTENEIRYLLEAEYAARKMQGIVFIIGSDERIQKYRHCVATDKKIERLVMLAPACQKYGLTVPITRMIYFGDSLPRDLAAKYETLCRMEAATLRMCRPGSRFADILEMQKALYQENGYPEEWEKHCQGGITGYIVNDASYALNPTARIVENQAFNWYLTISGAKVEETVLAGSEKTEILTHLHGWPDKEYESDGFRVRLPQILLK